MGKHGDRDSQNGNETSTCENLKDEGSHFVHVKQFQKAIDSLTKALELDQKDITALVTRSKCWLQLGQAENALTDAEAALKEDDKCIRGMYQKAEALYQLGDFEMALVFFHRGNKLRPEFQDLRIGIQKCEEAINNSIGTPEAVRLEASGDLSYFYKHEEQKELSQLALSAKSKTTYGDSKAKQSKGTYQKPGSKKESQKERERPKSDIDQKTIKQLLGELYGDRQYLEKLMKDSSLTGGRSTVERDIQGKVFDGVIYLDSRADFWRQQKPMYARKRDKEKQRRSAKTPYRDIRSYVLRSLDEIEEEQSSGNYESSLKKAQKVLKQVEGMSSDELQNRAEIMATLYSCIGNAHLEMSNYNRAMEYHERDLDLSKEHDLEDAKSRALDNMGRVYARKGSFQKAIEVWEQKIPMSKSPLESAWLFHEIGRCHLELQQYVDAKDNGRKALEGAKEAEDQVWILHSTVLIAQAEVKSEELQAAASSFEDALETAKILNDTVAEQAIRKALDEVNTKIVRGEGDDVEEEEGQQRPGTAGSAKVDSRPGSTEEAKGNYEDDFEEEKDSILEAELNTIFGDKLETESQGSLLSKLSDLPGVRREILIERRMTDQFCETDFDIKDSLAYRMTSEICQNCNAVDDISEQNDGVIEHDAGCQGTIPEINVCNYHGHSKSKTQDDLSILQSKQIQRRATFTQLLNVRSMSLTSQNLSQLDKMKGGHRRRKWSTESVTTATDIEKLINVKTSMVDEDFSTFLQNGEMRNCTSLKNKKTDKKGKKSNILSSSVKLDKIYGSKLHSSSTKCRTKSINSVQKDGFKLHTTRPKADRHVVLTDFNSVCTSQQEKYGIQKYNNQSSDNTVKGPEQKTMQKVGTDPNFNLEKMRNTSVKTLKERSFDIKPWSNTSVKTLKERSFDMKPWSKNLTRGNFGGKSKVSLKPAFPRIHRKEIDSNSLLKAAKYGKSKEVHPEFENQKLIRNSNSKIGKKFLVKEGTMLEWKPTVKRKEIMAAPPRKKMAPNNDNKMQRFIGVVKNRKDMEYKHDGKVIAKQNIHDKESMALLCLAERNIKLFPDNHISKRKVSPHPILQTVMERDEALSKKMSRAGVDDAGMQQNALSETNKAFSSDKTLNDCKIDHSTHPMVQDNHFQREAEECVMLNSDPQNERLNEVKSARIDKISVRKDEEAELVAVTEDGGSFQSKAKYQKDNTERVMRPPSRLAEEALAPIYTQKLISENDKYENQSRGKKFQTGSSQMGKITCSKDFDEENAILPKVSQIKNEKLKGFSESMEQTHGKIEFQGKDFKEEKVKSFKDDQEDKTNVTKTFENGSIEKSMMSDKAMEIVEEPSREKEDVSASYSDEKPALSHDPVRNTDTEYVEGRTVTQTENTERDSSILFQFIEKKMSTRAVGCLSKDEISLSVSAERVASSFKVTTIPSESSHAFQEKEATFEVFEIPTDVPKSDQEHPSEITKTVLEGLKPLSRQRSPDASVKTPRGSLKSPTKPPATPIGSRGRSPAKSPSKSPTKSLASDRVSPTKEGTITPSKEERASPVKRTSVSFHDDAGSEKIQGSAGSEKIEGSAGGSKRGGSATSVQKEKRSRTPSAKGKRSPSPKPKGKARTPSPKTKRGRSPSPKTKRGRSPSPKTKRGRSPSPKTKQVEVEKDQKLTMKARSRSTRRSRSSDARISRRSTTFEDDQTKQEDETKTAETDC